MKEEKIEDTKIEIWVKKEEHWKKAAASRFVTLMLTFYFQLYYFEIYESSVGSFYVSAWSQEAREEKKEADL